MIDDIGPLTTTALGHLIVASGHHDGIPTRLGNERDRYFRDEPSQGGKALSGARQGWKPGSGRGLRLQGGRGEPADSGPLWIPGTGFSLLAQRERDSGSEPEHEGRLRAEFDGLLRAGSDGL